MDLVCLCDRVYRSFTMKLEKSAFLNSKALIYTEFSWTVNKLYKNKSLLFSRRLWGVPLLSLFALIFSWAELKAQWNLLLTCCPWFDHLSFFKLVTFSSLLQNHRPTGLFKPQATNLAQNILVLRGFEFVQMEDQALFQREIIAK